MRRGADRIAPGTFQRTAALGLAALILLVVANVFPLLTLEIRVG
ncbi:MAG: paraquat-inducible protein A [bacterium]